MFDQILQVTSNSLEKLFMHPTRYGLNEEQVNVVEYYISNTFNVQLLAKKLEYDIGRLEDNEAKEVIGSADDAIALFF